MTFTFFLGAHHPSWLHSAGVPLFVSRRTLSRLKSLPRAIAPWALDSGAFTELSLRNGWHLSAREYVAEVRRYRDEVGSLQWCAPQDWPCEADVVRRTGLTIEEHQARTTANYLELRSLAPELPIVPVIQGWTIGDYLRHTDQYHAAGVDLASLPLVGIGSVCRRQNTVRASALLAMLRADGLRLHGFGIKAGGLRSSANVLASADSMAWSYAARRETPLPGHELRHQSCANCLEYALDWRTSLLDSVITSTR